MARSWFNGDQAEERQEDYDVCNAHEEGQREAEVPDEEQEPDAEGLDMEQGLEVCKPKEEPEEELAQDTYALPCVLLYAARQMPEEEQWMLKACSAAAAVCITCPLALLQYSVLFVVMRGDLWTVVVDVSPTVYLFQLGALIIVWFSLLPDLKGALKLCRLGDSRLDLWSVLGYVQAMSVFWAAWTSAMYIFAQNTEADVALGAMTLTFVVTLDEIVMAGLLLLTEMNEGDKLLGATLTWKVKQGNLQESWDLFCGMNMIYGMGSCGCGEVETVRVPVRCWMLFLMVSPLYLMLGVASAQTSIDFSVSAGPCEGHPSRTTPITTKHFCEHAARSLALADTEAQGAGTCMFDREERRLFLGDPEEHRVRSSVEFLCQPAYVALPQPFLLGAWGQKEVQDSYGGACVVFGMKDAEDQAECTLCTFHHMEEIRSEFDCTAALRAVEDTPSRRWWWWDLVPVYYTTASCHLADFRSVCRMPSQTNQVDK